MQKDFNKRSKKPTIKCAMQPLRYQLKIFFQSHLCDFFLSWGHHLSWALSLARAIPSNCLQCRRLSVWIPTNSGEFTPTHRLVTHRSHRRATHTLSLSLVPSTIWKIYENSLSRCYRVDGIFEFCASHSTICSMLCDDDVFISQDNSMTIIIKFRMPRPSSSASLNFTRKRKIVLWISAICDHRKFRFNYLKFFFRVRLPKRTYEKKSWIIIKITRSLS